MAKKREDFSLKNLLGEFTNELAKTESRPTIYRYKPHDKQIAFHQSNAPGRLYIGGNRSGKTVGGIVEDIQWALGKHPYLHTPPPPTRGRILTVDFDNGWAKIIRPEIQRWLPPSALIDGDWDKSWDGKEKILTLANGSTIDIMSYLQPLNKFMGTSRHWTHFDEEPPSAIFKECKLRLLDTLGRWWMTMTPVEGMTWTFDEIYEVSADGQNPLIDVIEVDVDENPYVTDEQREQALSGFDGDELAMRKSGKFINIGGLILKNFNPSVHVIKQKIPPKSWDWVRSMDHGFNNPSAWYYHAIGPDGIVVTFFEHYRREWTIGQHANRLHEIDKEFGKVPDRSVGDPAIKQRLPNTGKSVHREYLEKGIPILTSNNRVDIGIDQLNAFQANDRWFITENCVKLIWEIKRYRWKTRQSKLLQEKHGSYDEPHKKDDHAVDSCRYFFINLPPPPVAEVGRDRSETKKYIETMLDTRTVHDISRGHYDPNFTRIIQKDPEIMEIDEHMGGIY